MIPRSGYLDVAEFHDAFGFPVKSEPDPVMDHADANLRRALTGEEHNEVQDALKRGHIAEIAGELGDLQYVNHGTKLSLGLQTSDHLHAVAGEVLHAAVVPLVDALAAGDHVEAAKAVIRTDIALQGIAAVLGIPMGEVMTEVHRSNMAKLWPDGKPRIEERGPVSRKVLKPSTWTPPNMTHVLHMAGIIVPALLLMLAPAS